MLNKYNRYKILKVFLYNPTESFRLRELSRLSKLAPLSVMNYLKEFEKENLIKRFEKRGVPFYQAERDHEDFKMLQKISIQFELHNSGLINYLWENLSPEAIILYGSFSKGDAIESSDIDLFVITKGKEINLESFEKKLGKKTHLITSNSLKNQSKEFKNNLANGIILKGYLKIIQ